MRYHSIHSSIPSLESKFLPKLLQFIENDRLTCSSVTCSFIGFQHCLFNICLLIVFFPQTLTAATNFEWRIDYKHHYSHKPINLVNQEYKQESNQHGHHHFGNFMERKTRTEQLIACHRLKTDYQAKSDQLQRCWNQSCIVLWRC